MSEWWESAPLAGQTVAPSTPAVSANWWDAAPIAGQQTHSPLSPEQKSLVKQMAAVQNAQEREKITGLQPGNLNDEITKLILGPSAYLLPPRAERALAQGSTFGQLPKIEAGIKSASNYLTGAGDTSYEEEKAISRAKEEAYKQERPYSSAALETAGMVGSTLAGGELMAAPKFVGAAINKIPTWLGRSSARGALAGAPIGAAEELGAADISSPQQALEAGGGGALKGGLTGAAAGPVVEAVAYPAIKAAQALRNSLKYATSTAEQRGQEAFAQQLSQAGVNARQVAESAAPISEKATVSITPEQHQLIIQGKSAGIPTNTIAQETGLSPSVVEQRFKYHTENTSATHHMNAMEQAMLAQKEFRVELLNTGKYEANGTIYPTFEEARSALGASGKIQPIKMAEYRIVNGITNEPVSGTYSSKTIADIAADKMRTNPFGARNILRAADAANTIPGSGQALAEAELLQRASGQSPRLENAIEKLSPGDLLATREARQIKLDAEMKKKYGDFYKEPGILGTEFENLRSDPMFKAAENFARQRESRMGANAASGTPVPQMKPTPPGTTATTVTGGPVGWESAMRGIKPSTSVTPVSDLYSPQMIDNIQRELRLASEGFTDPNKAAAARHIRELFLEKVEKAYPQFRGIRKEYFDAKGLDSASEAGRAFFTNARAGEKMDAVLNEFKSYTKPQQEEFKLAGKQALLDVIKNKDANALNDLTVSLRRKSARDAIEVIFGKDAAENLAKTVDAEQMMHITKNVMTSGSQTAGRIAGRELFSIPSEITSALEMTHPATFLASYRKSIENYLQSGKAAEFLKISLESDPTLIKRTMNKIADIQDRLPKYGEFGFTAETDVLRHRLGQMSSMLSARVSSHPDAKIAEDGNHYIPDPSRPGKYLMVVPH